MYCSAFAAWKLLTLSCVNKFGTYAFGNIFCRFNFTSSLFTHVNVPRFLRIASA